MKRQIMAILGLGLIAGVFGWTAPAFADAQVLLPTSGQIDLETGKGVLIRLDRPAGTVFVANPEVADIQVKSPHLIYLLAKSPGETTLYAVDQDERVLANRRISVSHNLTRLERALKELLPDAQIKVRTVDSSLVLSGLVETATDAEDARRLAESIISEKGRVLLKLGITAPNQVHLRVRVAEVSRAVIKTLGIDWSATFATGGFLLGLATGNPLVTAAGVLSRSGTNSLSASFNSTKVDLNGLIDALDDEGLITVLAEPNLTALSGKTATFLAGGEFPIVVAGEDNQISVEFKEFGVSLAFTPTIIGKNRISLEVAPEVSQLSTVGAVQISGFSIPSLTTRRAKTTVELGSGQSFAIAGLLQNNVTHNIDKFPGLGEIPILGALFRSDTFKRDESELVIIVTPYLVRPVSSTRMAGPTDGFTAPSDRDRILHGRMYKPNLKHGQHGPRADDGKILIGGAGFVLD